MPIRVSGLNSGLDTDSIVQELVSAYRTKGDKIKKQQTKLSWTQDKWKSLNAKVLNLYKSLDSLRFSSGYNMKKTTVSDLTKATVTAGKNAVNGTQTLRVDKVAKGGYLTGGQLKGNKKGSAATLASLDSTIGTGTYRISGNGVTKDIQIDGNTKISDFVDQLNKSGTGVQASYDEANQRLFISSKNTGASADFTLTALDAEGEKALSALGVNVSSKTSGAEAAQWIQYYDASANGGTGGVDRDKLQAAVIAAAKEKKKQEDLNNDITARQSHNTKLSAAVAYTNAAENINDVNALKPGGMTDQDFENDMQKLSYLAKLSESDRDKDYIQESDGTVRAATADDDQSKVFNGKTEYQNLKAGYMFAETQDKLDANNQPVLDANNQPVKEETKIFQQIKAYSSDLAAKKAYENEKDVNGDPANATYVNAVNAATTSADIAALRTSYQNMIEGNNTGIENDKDAIETSKETLEQNYKNIDSAALTMNWSSFNPDDPNTFDTDFNNYVDSLAAKVEYFNSSYVKKQDDQGNDIYVLRNESKGANKIDGQDAVIRLNGAEFTSQTNTFNVNGLTIQTLAESKEDITITTATDTQGLYDKIKDFISEYNSIINEMSTLYNAPSSKGYEPLTSDEKQALSESEIADWEKKIKDSLLRRDGNLSTLMNAMTSAMSKTYEINGKKYSLASLGIKTGSYFNTTAADRYELHIDGDPDDDTTSANADQLMAMLNSDPDTVISIIQGAASDLSENLSKQMKSSTLRSYQSIYNDKAMAQSYSDYTKKISAWEEKVTAIEESYYKKFAAMETALAKLQSQQSAFAGMLGS